MTGVQTCALRSSGAPKAIITAAMAISWPATGKLTFSELDRSFKVPAVAITPVPMAKLPTNKAHLALTKLRGAAASFKAQLSTQDLQRVTFNASGLTMFVGVPLMKLTTLSNAPPKNSS